MDAKEYRKKWLNDNPGTIHIPSEHEIELMEGYAKQHAEQYSALKEQEVSDMPIQLLLAQWDKEILRLSNEITYVLDSEPSESKYTKLAELIGTRHKLSICTIQLRRTKSLGNQKAITTKDVKTSDEQVVPAGTEGTIIEILAPDRVYFECEYGKICMLIDTLNIIYHQ